jgi:hypothetical protein
MSYFELQTIPLEWCVKYLRSVDVNRFLTASDDTTIKVHTLSLTLCDILRVIQSGMGR